MSDLHEWVTTGNSFDGYRVSRHFGVVRGITVRSRSVFGTVGAGLQSLVGGRVGLYVDLCEAARKEAYDLMIEHAAKAGANAIVAMRYDANEIAQGITEVIAYGTAVTIVPVGASG